MSDHGDHFADAAHRPYIFQHAKINCVQLLKVNFEFCTLALLKFLELNIIVLVKAPTNFNSLNEVCKQSSFRNVKRDIWCRKNMASIY